MSDLITCPHCHTQNPPGSKFCNNCGTPVQPVTTRRCPHCQTTNPITNFYCDQCGNRLLPEETGKRRENSDTPSETGLKAFSLPIRNASETGELTPDALLDWLKEPKETASSTASPAEPDSEQDNWVNELHNDQTGLLSIPETRLLNTVDFEGDGAIENDDFADLLQLGTTSDALPDWLADSVMSADVTPSAAPPTLSLPEPDWLDPAAETAVNEPTMPETAVSPWLEADDLRLSTHFDWLSALENNPPAAKPPAAEPASDHIIPPPTPPPPLTIDSDSDNSSDEDDNPTVGNDAADDSAAEWQYAPIQTESHLPDWLHELQKPSDEDKAWEDLGNHLGGTDELPDWVQGMRPSDDQLESNLPNISETGALRAANDLADLAADLDDGDLGGDLPDWLGSIATPPPLPPQQTAVSPAPPPSVIDSAESLNAALSALPPTPNPTQSLAQAEMPDWVKALNPSQAPVKTQKTVQKQGPLAGVRDVVDIEPVIAAPRQSLLHVATFTVSPEQQQQAALLQQIVRAGDLPASSQQPADALGISRPLRLALALLLLLAIGFGLLGPTLAPSPVAPPPPHITAVVNALSQAANQPVLVAFAYTPALAGELNPIAQALLAVLTAQNSPILTVTQAAAGTAVAQAQSPSATHLGYLPGGAIGLRLLRSCFDTPCATLAGSPLSTIAGQQLTDIALVLLITGEQDALVGWVEQVAPANMPLIAATTQSLQPVAAPYLASGQLAAAMGGTADLLPFQQQTGQATAATQTLLQGQSIAQLVALLALVVGSLVYGLGKAKGEASA